MMGVRYTICHWAINRTDPQNLLSTTLDVPLQKSPVVKIAKSLFIFTFLLGHTIQEGVQESVTSQMSQSHEWESHMMSMGK